MFIVFCANFCNNPHAVMAKHTYTKELIEENVLVQHGLSAHLIKGSSNYERNKSPFHTSLPF